MLNNIILKPYDIKSCKWLLINQDSFFVINEETKNLIEYIKNSLSVETAMFELSIRYNVELTEIKLFLESKFNEFGISFEDKKILIVNKPFMKHKKILFKSNFCKNTSKWCQSLISKKYFHYIFLTLMLINICFIFLLKPISLLNSNINQIIILIFILLPAVIFHELGHVGATEKFGAKNGGVGIGLFLFFPVLYSDVTKIWLLEKKERIIVNLSGVYIQSYYSLGLFILATVFKQQIFFNCAFLIFVSGIYQLFPFIRSDGYWLISDLSGIYNLKKRSNILEQIKLLKTKQKINFFILVYGILDSFFIFFIIYLMVFKNWNYFKNIPFLFIENLKNGLTFQFSKINFDYKIISYLIIYFILINIVFKQIVFTKKIYFPWLCRAVSENIQKIIARQN